MSCKISYEFHFSLLYLILLLFSDAAVSLLEATICTIILVPLFIFFNYHLFTVHVHDRHHFHIKQVCLELNMSQPACYIMCYLLYKFIIQS